MKKLFIIPALLLIAAAATGAHADTSTVASPLPPVGVDLMSAQYGAPAQNSIAIPSLLMTAHRSTQGCQAGGVATTPGTGGFEIGGGGSINFGSGATVGNIDGTVGYFLANPWEVGVDIDLLFTSGGGGGTDGIIGPFVRYHFNNGGKTVPYLDAGVLFSVGNGFAGNNAIISVGGGIDFFFRSNQAFYAEARGLITTGGGNNSLGQINFGLRSYFPR